jgi:hypothetical protein
MSDIHNGVCFADPEAAIPLEKLMQCCNPGHARSICLRAETAEIDSFRLMVRSDDGIDIEVAWAGERNHHPVAVGALRLSRPFATPAATPLERQARACAEAYLRQTGQL